MGIAGETRVPVEKRSLATALADFLGEPSRRTGCGTIGFAAPFWRKAAPSSSPAVDPIVSSTAAASKGVFPTRSPSFFTRAQVATWGRRRSEIFKQSFSPKQAVADFSIDYGLPKCELFKYRRPFDYFTLQFTMSSANASRTSSRAGCWSDGTMARRGPIAASGDSTDLRLRAPQVFRVSSTALGLGTTLQRRISGSSALQTSIIAGLGYGAAGTIHGTSTRDFHYGMTPQALVANRFIASNRVALEVTLRDYYVSSVAATEHNGTENILRADALFTYRFHTNQAMSVRYVWSQRNASYPDLGNVVQSRGSVGLFYTYLGGGSRFGAVDW